MEWEQCALSGGTGIIILIMLHYLIQKLKVKYEGDIRILWYVYSLTIVISAIIGIISVYTGAIDSKGTPQGDYGDMVNWLISASLDINLSIMIVTGLVVTLILPQMLSYLISALHGISSNIIFFSEGYSFFMWWVIKTFILASGVMTVIVIFGAVLSWDSFDAGNIIGWVLVTLFVILLAFFVLAFYRLPIKNLKKIQQKIPIIDKIHNWCSRHSNAIDSDEKTTEEIVNKAANYLTKKSDKAGDMISE